MIMQCYSGDFERKFENSAIPDLFTRVKYLKLISSRDYANHLTIIVPLGRGKTSQAEKYTHH